MISYWASILQGFRWQDAIDIILVSLLIYQALLLLRGTRALQIFIGLSVLFLLYWASDRFELRTVNALLATIFENWILILILLFHQDFRRALSRFGRASFFRAPTKTEKSQFIEELIRSCISLANKKIGALIVLEREADIDEFIDPGVKVDAKISKEVISSIFMPVSPLHDGALIVRDDRLAMAGCFLPLSLNPLISKSLGTRHRAALGITEETDAICIVVSEENGLISFAAGGKITHELDGPQLRRMLIDTMESK